MLAYSSIILCAMLAASVVASHTQRDLGLSRAERFGIGFGGFCGAMIGAKLPFVLADWPGLLSGAAWLADGKTILLGLAGGYAGVELTKWSLDVRTRTGDSFVLPVATAIAIGRLGCFVGGCCYGTPTALPWGVVFPKVDSLARHPTQLYESAFHATCGCLFALLLARGWFRGNLIKLYIIVYAVYRFASESIRPEIRYWAGLTAYQWASLALIVGFAALWRRDLRN